MWHWSKGGIYLVERGKTQHLTTHFLLSSSSASERYLFHSCYPKAFISQLWVKHSNLSLDDSFFTLKKKKKPHSRERKWGRETAKKASEGARIEQGLCFTATLPIWKDKKVERNFILKSSINYSFWLRAFKNQKSNGLNSAGHLLNQRPSCQTDLQMYRLFTN